MLNKAKIGDKVYHYQKERFQDLIITKIKKLYNIFNFK